ncbi:Aminopeptidase [Sphingomonas sp. EC-HK361]|nr:Aminopeptidase [Sphingomonas sp. EC-HK361]
MLSLKLAAATVLALTVSSEALAAGQLPRTVVPVSYDISVKPNAAAKTFTGTETVVVDVKTPTDSIVLNAAELSNVAATFDGKPVKTAIDEAAQQMTVTLPARASAGRHTMTFAWTGKINGSAAGLFSIDYTNVDGSPGQMLATQFEAPDARRFAPMWDEPGLKATFKLTATVPAGDLAISNTPAVSVTKQADGSQLYRFAQTPVMSSYLLYFGTGKLDRKTVKAGPTEIGIVTRKGVVDQGDYSLGAAKNLLGYYNNYFGQPYPLPKMDMIAGPGSSQFFGAMENWGAIFYFENEVLFDPKRTTESGRQRIYTVVAHEMAHQWFGDLVTMAWWDDLWLNEGFASWMETKATADLNPQWQARAAAIISDREQAMGIDATAATHPIVRHVETVDQISEAFDGITYAKGQAVIGMLESTLGPDVFRQGIRSYMAKYKYKNTQTDQLWAELSKAWGKPVAEIAHDFTLQGGVPLVTLTGARCEGGKTVATLTQGRFGLDAASKAPQTWRVPLVVATLGGGQTSTIVRGAAGTQVSVPGCGAIVLNHGKGSYTRVMYDDATHAAIVRDYTKLDLEDRLGTIADDYALARGGYQDLSRWTAVLDRIGAGASPLEWAAVTGEMAGLGGLYENTPLGDAIDAKSRTLLSPVLQRLGMSAKAGESILDTNLREGLVGRLGAVGDPAVVALARADVPKLASNPTALPPATREALLSTYARNATSADWDTLLKLQQAERSPVAKNRLTTLLGAAHDPKVAQRAFGLLEGTTLSEPQRASLLASLGRSQPDMAFDWAVAHRALVDSFVEQSSRAGFVVGLGAGSNDAAMPGKIQAYADKYLPEGSRGGAKRALTTIATRKAVADRLRPAVSKWLGM